LESWQTKRFISSLVCIIIRQVASTKVTVRSRNKLPHHICLTTIALIALSLKTSNKQTFLLDLHSIRLMLDVNQESCCKNSGVGTIIGQGGGGKK